MLRKESEKVGMSLYIRCCRISAGLCSAFIPGLKLNYCLSMEQFMLWGEALSIFLIHTGESSDDSHLTNTFFTS